MRLSLTKKPKSERKPTFADVSPETERILQALERGQRSQIPPMPMPVPRRIRVDPD